MIQEQEFEHLLDNSIENITIDRLLEIGKIQENKWEDYLIDNSNSLNFLIDDNKKFICLIKGVRHSFDISEFAFAQLCQKVGVPASYVKKCFDYSKIELALMNFREWAREYNKDIRIRVYDGTVRAILSSTYVTFSNFNVISVLSENIKEYELKNILLTSDKLHLRFLSNLYSLEDKTTRIGFIVDSSDIGRGSLNVKLYLYFEDINSGIIVSNLGGTLFKQNHIGSKMTGGKLAMFNRSLVNVEKLTDKISAILEIKKQQMNIDSFDLIVDRALKDLRMSDKSINLTKEQLKSRSKLELIKAIAWVAKEFTLETRIDYEKYAGDLFTS